MALQEESSVVTEPRMDVKSGTSDQIDGESRPEGSETTDSEKVIDGDDDDSDDDNDKEG